MKHNTMTAVKAEDTENLISTLKDEYAKTVPAILEGTVSIPMITENTAILSNIFARYMNAVVNETKGSIRNAMADDDKDRTNMARTGVCMASRLISYFRTIEDEYRPYITVIYQISNVEDYLTELFMRTSEASARVNHILDVIKPYPFAMIMATSDYTGLLTKVRDNTRAFRDRIADMRKHADEYKSSDDLPEECFSRVYEMETLSWYALAFTKFIEAAFPGRKTKPLFSAGKIADVMDPMVMMASQALMFKKFMGKDNLFYKSFDDRAERLGETYNNAYKEVKEILSDDDNRFGLHIGHMMGEKNGYYVNIACDTQKEVDELPDWIKERFTSEKEAEEAADRLKKLFPNVIITGISEIPDEEYYTVLTNGDNLNATGEVFGCRIMAIAYLIITAKPEKIINYLISKGAVNKAAAGRPSIVNAVREKAMKKHDGNTVPKEVMDKMIKTRQLISAYVDFSEDTVSDGAAWLEGFLDKNGNALPDGVTVSADVKMEKGSDGNGYFPLPVSVYDHKNGKKYTMLLVIACHKAGKITEYLYEYSTDDVMFTLGDLIRYGTEGCDKVLIQRSDGDDIDIDRIDPAVFVTDIRS